MCLGGESAVLKKGVVFWAAFKKRQSLHYVFQFPPPAFWLMLTNFQNTPFNILIKSAFRNVEMPSINIFLSNYEMNFKFCPKFFLKLQSPLSFF